LASVLRKLCLAQKCRPPWWSFGLESWTTAFELLLENWYCHRCYPF
jgi:hypothetical protein